MVDATTTYAPSDPDGARQRSVHQSNSTVNVKGHKSRQRERLRVKDVAHLLHRFAIVVCAVFYVALCFSATAVSIELLQGQKNPIANIYFEPMGVLVQHFDQATVGESRIVTEALANDTTPRTDTLYVDHNGVSSTPCANVSPTIAAIYENTYLRSLFQAVVDGTGYSAPLLRASELELIAPVVDCTVPSILKNNPTFGRFHFLGRQRNNPRNVTAVVLSMANQHYFNEAQDHHGTAALALTYAFQDLNDGRPWFQISISVGYPYVPFAFRVYGFAGVDVEGLCSMRSMLPTNTTEMPTVIKTARRVGYFRKAFSQQSNANNYATPPELTGTAALSQIAWFNNPVLHDAWAWVHLVQLAIGLTLASNLIVLGLATYRNFRAGKLWIGDAFVSVSTTQIASGVAVLVSWVMSGFWTLREFCMHDAAVHAGGDKMHIEPTLMAADLLTLYFSACGIIGLVTRERIDPLLASLTFLLGFQARFAILEALAPSLRDQIIQFYRDDLANSVSPQLAGQAAISPMRVWSAHDVGAIPASFIMQCVAPVIMPLVLVIVYAIARKIYRHFYPEPLHIQRGTSGTATSENEKTQSLIAQKRVLTLFEIATGAQLENRFGLVADYETCRFIKGMKFASADGIYTTGFVIANHKFLVQTRDLWSILLMKLMQKRFRNIYVYDVNGSTVQQTARLVYPHTLSFSDLLNINVSVLS